MDLAYNLWWSWNPEVKMVFKQLNPLAWSESIHNPVRMLSELPEETLIAASKNPLYLRHYDIVMSRFKNELDPRTGWYASRFTHDKNLTIAYFSAEYGLHHSLPMYAGGLGFLAGDHLKECSDLGVPLVAVGFMYSEGYLHQHIPPDGWQEGIQLMPVGSKYRFWIPANLGYGAKGTPGGPIGPNATLTFDVELMAILPPG